MSTQSVIKKNDDRIIIKDHLFLDVNDRYQRCPTCDLSELNSLYSYGLIHVTCCDPGPLDITLEKVLYEGDKDKCVSMITNMKVKPHPLGFLVNDIILPPGVGIVNHLSYLGKVEIDYFNHYKEIVS